MDLMYRDERVVSDRTVDSHVKKLRRKIADVLPDREVVHSVYGLGYKFEP
jgi:two-component system response regulator BaeR